MSDTNAAESMAFAADPERASDDPALIVDVEGFEGPLDLLLRLAREQKVDLAKISILALADQYLAFIEEARRLRLELAADYLVMAAWLAYLKSRLLLPEPPGGTGEFKDAIVALQTVYGTHHIGASTDQAQDAIAAETVRIVASYKDTGKVPNVVNLAKKTPATHMLVVRHCDRPGVLAHVFDLLRGGAINVQETENVIFEGAQAAVARINLDGAPSDALLRQIQDGNSDILDLHLVTI